MEANSRRNHPPVPSGSLSVVLAFDAIETCRVFSP